MKITFMLLLVSVVQLSASVYSQNVRFDMKLTNKTLIEVFEEIRNNSEFSFVYDLDDVESITDINVSEKEASVEEILNSCLENTNLTYEVIDKVVVVKQKPYVAPKSEQQEKKTIKGKVTDDQGVPLPGVSVVIKGTNIGVATDIDGNYSLELESGKAVLIFSFVGMLPQEAVYYGQSEQNITLTSDTEQMAEVVVTGYQTISKERATGAFEKVSISQIEKPSSSISERLVGMMAGVNTTVNADGEVDFEIRGQSSLLADAQPLIVVDGFPIEGNFSSINPNDVASVTVLKDAAAASIWGAKSANGVIVITTKKAKKGKARIEFSSFFKIGNKLDLDYVNPRASSAETIEYEKRGFNSDLFGGAVYWGYPSQSLADVGSGYSQAFVAMNEFKQGRISEAEMNTELTRLAGLNNQSQIKDHLLQNPVTQQYNLSISGGNERMSNILSIMYENNKNYFKENSVDKFMVNFRNKIEVAKWLDFEFGGMLQYNDKTNNGVSLGDIINLQPYDMLMDENGNLTDLSHMNYYKPVLDELVPKTAFPNSDWSYNPISEIKQRDFSTKDLNARIQAGLNFKLLEGLSYNTKILYEHFTTDTKKVYDANSFTMRRMVNETSTWDRNAGVVTPNMPSGGALKQNSATIRNYNFRNQVNFNRTFADKHAINFVAGTEMSSRVYEYKGEPDVIGYDDDKLTVGRLLNDYSSSTKMWNGYPITYARYFYPINLDPQHYFSYSTDRYFSLYGNLSYTFNDKYTLTGSIRTDASNLITDDPKYRYSPFWSTDFGWQMGKEDFLKGVEWLDRLNLRGTYGYNGNVDKSTSFLPLISVSGTANIYTNETTANVSSFGNPTLRWEKTRSLDIGLDFSVLKSKLHGSIDVYHKKGTDLIVSQSIASMNGTTSQKFNNGEMVNKGIELKIGTSLPLLGNDIKWNGNFNFAYNKNEITSFYKASYGQYDLYNGGTYAYSEGLNANTLWSFEYAGMRNLGTEADPKMVPTVKGVDGDTYGLTRWTPGTDARKFMVAEGTTVAPYIVGFHNSFKIYDFDLSFIVTGKFGHVYRRHSFNYPAMTGGNTNVNNKYSEVANGDPNKIVPIPGNEPRYYFYDRFFPYMSYLTENASHIRFQEASLSYNLPKQIISKLGFERVKVYAQGNNLGTILWNDFGEDPEYPIGTLKPQATYTLGVKISL
ncbi:SusC/RagA family TonB-linked outer membrane protein [Marinifilum fragile]